MMMKLTDEERIAIHAYKGSIQGDDPNGVYDIEFPSLIEAAVWADENHVADRVQVRDDTAGRKMDKPVVVQLFPTEAAE